MKSTILEFLEHFWMLLTSLSIALLVALALSALLQQWLNEQRIKQYIQPPHPGHQNLLFQIKAALLGFLFPACQTDPVANISLLQSSGFSRPSIQTSITAKTNSGLETLLPLFVVFGWMFSIYHLLLGLALAIISGVYGLLIKSPPIKVRSDPPTNFQLGNIPIKVENALGSNGSNSISNSASINSKHQAWLDTLIFDLYQPMFKPLLLGLLTGAFLLTLNPLSLTDLVIEYSFLNYFILIVLAIPLHFCSSCLIPVAIALVALGFTPGAVMLFLLISGTIHLDTIKALIQNPEGSVRYLYLLTLIIAAIFLVLPLDLFFAAYLPDLLANSLLRGELGFLEQICAVILLYWGIKNSFAKSPQSSSSCGGGCGCG